MSSPTIVCTFTARLDFISGAPARQADCVVLQYNPDDVFGKSDCEHEAAHLYRVIEQSKLHKLHKPEAMAGHVVTANNAWEDFTTRLFDRSLQVGQIIFVAPGTRHVLDALGVGEDWYWRPAGIKLVADPSAPAEPVQYPINHGPNIIQFHDETFVWYDEAGMQGGVCYNLEGANFQVDRHAQILDGTLEPTHVPKEQVEVLGQVLGELLVAAGVTNPDMPLTGPQLIGAAKHWTENLQKQAQSVGQDEGKDLGQIK